MRKCYICKTRNATKGARRCKKCGPSGTKYTERMRKKSTRYRAYLKDKCEVCQFIPIHVCQLDIDHRDGNKKNNDPSNLATLCANCHRLKTQNNKDFMSRPTECVAPPPALSELCPNEINSLDQHHQPKTGHTDGTE